MRRITKFEEMNKFLKDTLGNQKKKQTGNGNNSRLEKWNKRNEENTNQGMAGYGRSW